MKDYITKPIRAEGLQQMVDKWNSSSETPREALVSPEYGADEGGIGVPPITNNNNEVVCNSPCAQPVDISRAMVLLGDDRELFDEAIHAFIDGIPDTLDNLQSAISHADAEQVHAVAHGLKGAASNLCAEPTRRVAQKLEAMGRQDKLQGADSLLEELQGHLDRLQEFVVSLKEG